MAADYALILRIINASDDPPEALRALIAQEREHASYERIHRMYARDEDDS